MQSKNNKKLIIVGAGVSGLSAGIYAARSGFDVTILEQHMTFGGLSTSWSRKGYYFEGGMHWLTGSSPKFPLNKIWNQVGALQENNPIENRDPLYTLLDGEKRLCLYRYLPDMKKALLEYAPEDKKMIKRMCRDVKAFSHFYMPVFDIAGCKCKNPVGFNPFSFIPMLPAVLRVPFLVNKSFEEYVNKFKKIKIKLNYYIVIVFIVKNV
jgi:phytoene dehydrogenase-like protein